MVVGIYQEATWDNTRCATVSKFHWGLALGGIALGEKASGFVRGMWSGCAIFSFPEEHTCPVRTLCRVTCGCLSIEHKWVAVQVYRCMCIQVPDLTNIMLRPLFTFFPWCVSSPEAVWNFRKGGRFISDKLLCHCCSWYSNNSGKDAVKINVCVLKCLLLGFSAAVALLTFNIISPLLSCLL